MRVLGIDFTSAPSSQKPITAAHCQFHDGVLVCDHVERITDFQRFEHLLGESGPWIAGLDFPFSFAKVFLTKMNWPLDVAELAKLLRRTSKLEYLSEMKAFRDANPAGQKHVARQIDRLTGGAAPNNVVNPPVGRMIFEGLPRLVQSGANLPGLVIGDPNRSAVEAYPAVAAKRLIGTTAYKDGPAADAENRRNLRIQLLRTLAKEDRFGFRVSASQDVVNDAAGDDLDAVICASQAAWAFVHGHTTPQGPNLDFDCVEGWISDPDAFA